MPEASVPHGSLSPEIAKLAKKLADDPRSKVFIPLAEEYIKGGFYQEAAAVLEDGLKVYPTFVTALVALGRVYLHLDRKDKARAKLEEVTKISPENLLAHRMLAKLYLETAELESAAKSCAIVLAANPKDEEGLAIEARVAEQGGPVGRERRETTPRRKTDSPVQGSTPAAPDGPRKRSAQASKQLTRLQNLLETIQARRSDE